MVYRDAVPARRALAQVVGVFGGAWGIGGGAISAPFGVAVLNLPGALVAGAALAGTCATAVIGVRVDWRLPL